MHSITVHEDCEALRLTGCDGANHRDHRTFLLPFDIAESCDPTERIHVVRRRRWWHQLAHAFACTHPFGGLRATSRAAIDLMPFQLEPAIAVLRHARLRILIADEVGLGKTVQAGILLHELAQQSDGFRGIVLCPAGLRDQWCRELRTRFSLQTTIADTSWLAESARDLPCDVNPWSLPGIYVASLDLVKRPEVLRALEDVTWDVVVIDEVHALGPSTARLAAARAIGARSRRVVLLTATPPDGDPAHFSAISDIGRTAADPPITEFRRTRREVGIPSRRKSILLPIHLSEAEIRMHRLLERYTSLVWQEAGDRGDRTACLAAMVLRKRALSSAASLALSVRRRLAALGNPPRDVARQLPLPLGDEDPLDDGVSDDVMAASGLADAAFERKSLEEIATAAVEAAQSESKVKALIRLLSRIREPAIVFTEYRDTLKQVAAALGPDARPLLLHGEMLPRERVDMQRAFNRSGTLLLATDAASEGLNLHERCRLVVHFELPWTPTRLEQRTGRVDRLGQTRPVHEVVLVARDTAERFVLAPLVRRARNAAARGGRPIGAWDESAVAEMVIGGASFDAAALDDPNLTASIDLGAEAEAERRRLATVRSLETRTAAGSVRADILVTTDRSLRESAVLVAEVALENHGGRALHSELVPIAVSLSSALRGTTRQDLHSWATLLVEHSEQRITAAVRAHLHAALERTQSELSQLVRALCARERCIADAVPSPARSLVQAGLFDRRAVRAGAARGIVTSLLKDEAELRLRALSDDDRLHIRTRIIAVRVRRT